MNRIYAKRMAAALLMGSLSFGAPLGWSSPYTDDPQSQYPKDQTQDTFQFASMVACVIRSFAPERMVGVGQYLAYWDDNKCSDSGASVPSGTGSGGSSAPPPKLGKALVTVTQRSDNALQFEALLSITDTEDNIDIPKRIQVLGTIYSGANVTPPYGNWIMDFCSSTVGKEGTCDDGQGFLRVDGSGISTYMSGTWGYRTAKSVFTGSNGATGYGAIFADSVWRSENANALFAFAPGVYQLRDRQNNQEFCYNPSVNASGVRYSTWENFLYDRTSGNRVTYENSGFYLKSNLTGLRVGDVTSWGVNFWNEASAADKLAGATLLRADDTSQSFTLRKAPGRLQRVVTSVTTSLDGIDGIPINFGVWGYNSSNNTSIDNAKLLTSLGVTSTSTNLSLAGVWTKPSGSNAGYFTFTDYQDCSGGNCVVRSISGNPTRTLAQLFSFGVTNINGWVNGVNVSYQTTIASWDSGTQQQVIIPQANLKLVKQTSETVAPTDSSVPASLICVGNCPDVQSGALVDSRSTYWPPIAYTTLAWNSTLGAPTVTKLGVTKTVDWRDSNNLNNGHWYQLFDAADLTTMQCAGWNHSTNSAAQGYCTELVTNQANSTYYTWQSGNRWDAYDYLVYRSGSNAGTAVTPNPPLNLSYVVANAQGTESSYVGKTITIQSPQPGNLWLPGYCVNKNLEQTACTDQTDWVNSVSIPTATDGTGTVTLLNRAGAPTSTQYYAKWLKRGVYFQSISASNCAPLTGNLSQAENLSLPGLSDLNTQVKTMGLPWPTTPFDANPRVIDGILQ